MVYGCHHSRCMPRLCRNSVDMPLGCRLYGFHVRKLAWLVLYWATLGRLCGPPEAHLRVSKGFCISNKIDWIAHVCYQSGCMAFVCRNRADMPL